MDTCIVESSPFRKRVSAWGDCVLVVTGKAETKAIRLTENRVDQTRFGALRHNDCYGQTYGSKISTSCGHVHILPFDPVLWSHSLPHRTQIIYPPDASMIVGGLDLVPGKRVLEAGTGSGSLTHFFAQAVWPTGRVLSFEFHLGRVELAAEEFQAHGLSNVVSVSHRDVCADGFPPAGDPSNPDGVDAVSLDLPQPWLVIPSLTMVFRADCDARVCLILPVHKSRFKLTVSPLKKAVSLHIQTVECLQRN
ncbi:tRNA adenine N1 methyltransferase catalytic [Fasciola gigantica]|uniref:tRNA (adenine(58)-N(1))-methyltransferase catalytic subunit TRMT61A n=1 Tax=Fasciola gigantica TaxID=46835 RepID=A0A504YAH9_FASGI|nr:tRNA adenine N1 methyltransferase catalytic [Fasciola gigantica]